MTREETYKRFKRWAQSSIGNHGSDEDYNMAENIMALLSQEPSTDAISRQAVIDATTKYCVLYDLRELLADIETLPSVSTEKTGRCKDCKWWKDSDGLYRRGGHAESQCPINRREVFEGNGYCYMFEPKTQEVEE